MNGVPFDPGAGVFLGNPSLGWQYEALSGAVPLGLDENRAHVQPNGKYHYHGMPTVLLKNNNLSTDRHSPQIGWAADGFPIYAKYGYVDSKDVTSDIVELYASWQVKQGNRPSGEGNPGGQYDGTFNADYEFVEGSGLLDECNGRITVTPEYPEGIYAHYLTENWLVVPRCARGKIYPSVRMHGPRPSI